jgi:Cdc6-like AAA superfamily ATPase
LRNHKDLETLIDELSALADKKTLLEIYNLATQEPHSFLYINLMAKDINDMFHIRFDRKILLD